MKSFLQRIAFGWLISVGIIKGSELTVRLDGVGPISRRTVHYQCDASSAKLGLPQGAFDVEYISAGESSLALLPIHKKTMVFSSVSAASGVRYVARDYQWWEAAGRGVSLRQESPSGVIESVCQKVK